MASKALYVTSHVGRDLLQAAALFKTDKLVIWEYVSNGLQYVDPGTKPCVVVTLDSKMKRITVKDNGRGMDRAGLEQFFQMHGENVDRKEGRAGRGRFGTGKSAAFGIGDVLRVTTVRHGRRSRVELRRGDIEAMVSGDPIPVRVMESDVSTAEENGTVVEIEGIHLKSVDQPGIISYIERHLARWPRDVMVFVNNHQCEFAEPPVAQQFRFKAGAEAGGLGDVELLVKVAKAPLAEELRGVAIFANGVWCETTLAGGEGREMSQYIFGEVDVPRLDAETGPMPAFDMSRSMRLNPNNPVVQAAYAFIGRHVEAVRRDLVAADKRRRATEEARRLQAEADRIAEALNDDFDAFKRRLAQVKAKAGGRSDLVEELAREGEEEILKPGGEVLGVVVRGVGGSGGDGGAGTVTKDSKGDEKGTPTGEKRGRRQGSRGGFRVVFDSLGAQEYRAKYAKDSRTIYVNLDHPQIAAAKGLGDTEDASFRRLAYEVAFAEYAVALASELASRDEYLDPSDPIVDIRETLNRLAKRGASLYESR